METYFTFYGAEIANLLFHIGHDFGRQRQLEKTFVIRKARENCGRKRERERITRIGILFNASSSSSFYLFIKTIS